MPRRARHDVKDSSTISGVARKRRARMKRQKLPGQVVPEKTKAMDSNRIAEASAPGFPGSDKGSRWYRP